MKNVSSLLAGFGLGLAAMYLWDPRLGRRRRALTRDKMVHAARLAGRSLDVSARDMSHRIQGLAHEMGSARREKTVPDEVLVARVRSRLGRVCSHPHAVRVEAANGVVTLSGPILREEARGVLRAIRRVPGVKEIFDNLEEYKTRGEISALQGGSRRPGQRVDVMQSNWSPATRLVMGLIGGGAAMYGGTRRDAVGSLVSMAGMAVLGRSLTNLEMRRMFGLKGRKAIDIRKSIEIHAPVDEVFDFWTRFENFPRFMSHLKEVQNLGGGRSRWVATGPGGVPVHWDAEITRLEPDQIICWKSVENSTVCNAGRVRFEPAGDDLTRIHVQMTYNPPAGALGHSIAWLFAVDPRHAMDEDLIRLKSLLENGKTHCRGEYVTRESVQATAAAGSGEAGAL